MIRGPVLPQLRASVWSQVARRLEDIERGLVLVLEGVDCSAGQFGLVEGLARDAMGGAVLVLIAVDGDGLLTARAHAACEFLVRLGEALPTSVPEANLVQGARGRVLVLGTEVGAGSLDLLCRLPLPGLEVCRLESFRVAGSERLAVRWLEVDGNGRGVGKARAVEFEVPHGCQRAWDDLHQLCERIDPGVAWDGDRFSRRLTWRGRLLGRLEVCDGDLVGVDAHDVRQPVSHPDDVRRFVDGLLRRFSLLAGLGGAPIDGDDDRPAGVTVRDEFVVAPAESVRTGSSESLRSTLSTARLSAEEYSALGAPTAAGGGSAEYSADEVARIVTAKSGAWSAQRRTD